MTKDFFDAVYGCLIGGAIGDAMGAPVENWHYADIRETYGKVRELLPHDHGAGLPGSITDDTTLRHYMCLAIVRKGGRITPDDYARVWLEDMNPQRLFHTERMVLEKLKLGMNPWETGRGNLLADAAIMSIAPIGIINAANPSQAYQDAFCVASIHQDGIERDAAAAMAAGFAEAFTADASVEGVLRAAEAHGTQQVRRLVSMAMDLARDAGTADAFVERFYATKLDRSFPVPPGEAWEVDRSPSPTSREVLPAVVGVFYLCEGDPERCIVEAASFGRDADTIATLSGGLAGALRGASALRASWIEQCERANEEFFAEVEDDPEANFRRMAERLVGAVESERRAVRDSLDALNWITPPEGD